MIGIYYPGDGAHNPPGMQIVSGATSVPGATITITLDSQLPIVVTANSAGLWQTSIMGVGIGNHTVRVAGPAGETVTRSFVVGTAPSAPVPGVRTGNAPIPPPPHAGASTGMSPVATVALVAIGGAALWWIFGRGR